MVWWFSTFVLYVPFFDDDRCVMYRARKHNLDGDQKITQYHWVVAKKYLGARRAIGFVLLCEFQPITRMSELEVLLTKPPCAPLTS